MAVLVTGGAGYIGSHMVNALVDGSEQVIVVDDLSSGDLNLVGRAAVFYEGNVSNSRLISTIIAQHSIDTIIHFAGSVVVPESMKNPLKYYDNNTSASRNLIEVAVASGVPNFIFSSTAAVYGEVGLSLVDENAPVCPVSPYGRSKLMTELMLNDVARAHDFRHVSLRYFNVAGADEKGRCGQSNRLASHLIKKACQVALGRAQWLDVYGQDYPTPDGTGVRDYVHVSDLVDAHVLAINYLRDGGRSATMNCGYGRGASVLEIAKVVGSVTGNPLPLRFCPRRLGDAPSVVADSRLLRETLGWSAKYDDLELIVRTALMWEKRLIE